MAKKQSASSVRAKQTAKKRKPMRDDGIDYSDIPPSTDEELQRARRVGRPKGDNTKQLIAIRIAPSVISSLRKMADKQDKPYQTLINEILEKAVSKAS